MGSDEGFVEGIDGESDSFAVGALDGDADGAAVDVASPSECPIRPPWELSIPPPMVLRKGRLRLRQLVPMFLVPLRAELLRLWETNFAACYRLPSHSPHRDSAMPKRWCRDNPWNRGENPGPGASFRWCPQVGQFPERIPLYPSTETDGAADGRADRTAVGASI